MRQFPSPDIGMFGRRQRHPRGHRIPVRIVGHFAGANAPDTIVVTDHLAADDVMPLPGGCICCTVRNRLQTALRRLVIDRENKPFTRVTIETTNDLGPILRTFATERALGAEFYVEEAPALSVADRMCQFELIEDAPISWQAFSRCIATLTALRGADLLHASGLVNVEGCFGPVAVQLMGHLTAPPVELQAWPGEERASRMEFVTRGIEETAVRSLFNSVCSFAPPQHTQSSP